MVKDWLNKECDSYGCNDRIEQRKLSLQLEETEQERDDIYKDLEKLQDTIKELDESLKKSMEEMLKKDKVDDKDADAIIKKIREGINNEKLSGIIQKNIQLHRDLSQEKESNKKLVEKEKKNIGIINTLENEIVEREKKDRELITQITEAEKKSKDIILEQEQKEIDLGRVTHKLDMMNLNIVRAKKEIKKIQSTYRHFTEENKKFKKENKILEKFYKQAKKKKNKNLRKINNKIKIITKLAKKKRLDRVQKLKPKIEKLYNGLNELEKSEIKEEYDYLMGL